MKLKLVVKYVLLISWLILIFWFSAQDGTTSGDMSDGFISKILSSIENIFNISLDNEQIIPEFVLSIRKLAHFFVYYVLGIFWMLLLKEYSISLSNQVIYAILFCFIYACSDEIHQLFVPGRSGNLLDVLVDMCGSFCSIIPIYFYKKYRKKTV